jgi:hypothetical protein
MATAQDSPNKPRPEDPLVREVADALNRIECNYDREGSGPGSRFEGRLREDVQAEAVVRLVRDAVRQATEGVLRRIVTTYSVQKIHAAAADAIVALEDGEPCAHCGLPVFWHPDGYADQGGGRSCSARPTGQPGTFLGHEAQS